MGTRGIKFELGQLVMTKAISAAMENKLFADEIIDALVKYCNQDWGICCLEDKEANDYAVENNERILGVYVTCNGKIWIITEADRSVTTILFPSEY